MSRTPAVEVISPAPRDAWRDALKSSADALIFQTPEWMDCARMAEGYRDASRLYETSDGRRIVVPMARRARLLPSMAAEASMPHGWGFGGLVSEGPLRGTDVALVLADLRSRSVLRTSIRPNPLVADAWAGVPLLPGCITAPHVTHVLDLEGGFAQVWGKRFDTSTRTKIRKAEKAGLIVERDTSGRLVPAFYQLYEDWLRDRARERRVPLPLALWLGRRREPLAKFKAVAQVFGDACRVWVMRKDDQPVASAILLVHGNHAFYWRSASDKVVTRQTRANDLLQRLMIEEACEAGCRYYHMGESGGVDSLMHFKSRFGGVPHPYLEYSFERLPLTRLSQTVGRLRPRSRAEAVSPGEAEAT